MITLYIHFNQALSPSDIAEIEELGHEVEQDVTTEDYYLRTFMEYSTDGEEADFTEEEAMSGAEYILARLGEIGISARIVKD